MIIAPPRETYAPKPLLRFVSLGVGVAIAVIFLQLAMTNPVVWPRYAAALSLAGGLASFVLLNKWQLTIHDDGVRMTTAFGVKEIEWRNVKEYRYRAVPERSTLAMHGGLLAVAIASMMRSSSSDDRQRRYLQIIDRDGASLRITPTLKDSDDAIDAALKNMHEQLRPQIASEIGATGALFGPLRLSARELQWKSNEPVALRDLESVQLAGTKLVIKKQGKYLKVVNVSSDRVPNVVLFVEEAEKLGVAGVRTNTLSSLFGR